MDVILPLICVIAGLAAGVFLMYAQMRRTDKGAREQQTRMQQSFDSQLKLIQAAHERQLSDIRESQKEQIAAFKESQEAQIQALKDNQAQQTAALKEEFERERIQMQEREQQQEEAIRRESVAQFKALAADIMTVQTAGLRQSNTEHINAILKPLSDNIESFRKAVNDSYVQESASRKSLTDQIDRLMKLNETIGKDAKDLTSALRGNSKVQGDWGEMILETMLENAGLEKGIHFTTQQTRNEDGTTLRNEEGALQRPDVILQLPDSRKLVIDSKVSLTAFADLCNASDEVARHEFSKRNLDSVRRHIDELAQKKYQETVHGSADHVLMFIPNEGAYIAAIQADANLWQYAYERNVAIVSPTHLFSVMKIVSQLWVQDKQNRNTLEIARRGGKLYEKVVGYVTALQDLGSALQKASTCYDTAFSRLCAGRGNIVKTAQELKELGAKTAKSLPQSLLEQADSGLPDS